MDIAVELNMLDESEALAVWIDRAEAWRTELRRLLTWTVHLEWYHPTATPNVTIYVAAGGHEIYRAPASLR